MRNALIALTAGGFALILGLACDDDGEGLRDPTATPAVTATATPILPEPQDLPAPPLSLSQPLDAGAALTDENLDSGAWFVLDVASGLVQVITGADEPCTGEGCGFFVGWHGIDTLNFSRVYANVQEAGFLVHLDGTVTRYAAAQASPIASSPTGGGASHDGKWQASVTASGFVGVVVGALNNGGAGEPAYNITSATLPLWSPRDDAVLALLVDVCSGPNMREGHDLAVFEPSSGELRLMSEQTGQLIPAFVWRPDGAAIAADIVFTGESATEPRREIALIDVPVALLASTTEFTSRTLVSISRDGELVPDAWNADGSKLLFTYSQGRGLCEGQGTPGEGTKVRVLPR